ncbi:MAG TPA: transglutaminase family protein, partial [Vicinamibacterales bacterium]|nr:transglutaminase family protein [Vicinamibacterales bacterium]
VTKPYSEEQWARLDALGRAVDADLIQHDVRLTMGGEPTFVSIDDRDGDEWNTAALGPTKRLRAGDLLRRLRSKFGANGFMHFGQGKWYPGEQLPRWALGCYWRADGAPAWHDASLLADESRPSGHVTDDAGKFLRALAETIGVGDQHVQPGYEDVWYYLWRERRLPVNVDPFDSRLDDELERARLRRVFDTQLDSVVGYALPLERDRSRQDGQWRSGPWFLRDERLYLIPGDSAMGYRLPLDSLPWVADADYPFVVEPDPTAPRPALSPSRAPRVQSRIAIRSDNRARDDAADRAPSRFESASWVVRTAMCAEARDGVVYVFMPPVSSVDDYLDLVSAIEATAGALSMPIVLEGYPPPHDPRLKHFLVTPDPGVIEVNVQASRCWDELVSTSTTVYDEARSARLSTEKFMLDGRHTGTGGGNHFVLGAAAPLDSPFLRRPDLLRSLLAYWHNHPSLSYLFSGLFIGPTSQAPRVDEARYDSLYELEIAFSRLPQEEGAAPPWLVDRALRHLLVDASGNTHRTEFCIDKLYAPESASGRRGFVELRAFEMPPHARMSLAQQLLLRALVARFWREPYAAPLVRWGTEIHDRFMLPHFVWLDFADVVEEMRRAGCPIEHEWFLPHFEFRFPLAGDMAARGVQLTLRQALEPWHVLGEEGSVGGTARYVDSSVERLQVHVTGLTPDRFLVACNGRAVPLQSTGRNGEYVAGVRYRAWQPASALHPTIPVHTPLTFDLIDTWMDRSLGGCQYHVMHPGGRNYDRFPVNGYEAESRRLARFSRLGHTPGTTHVAPAVPSREFPYTLDLRTP